MNVSGIWYNELGSKMILRAGKSSITGTYITHGGEASNRFNLLGKINDPADYSAAIGWVVIWKNEFKTMESVTCWSGQVQAFTGIDKIVTTWLLTTEIEMGDDWNATLIGKDVFTRFQPPIEIIEKNIKEGIQHSFPKRLITN